MRTRKTLIGAAIVSFFVVAILILVFGKVYFIRDDSGGEVLWNSNEAYLFMGVSRRGYPIRLIEYPWAFVKELLNGVDPPDDQSTTLTVIHITTSGVERHVIKAWDEQQANTPGFLTPLEGQIYANCRGSLCKWNGDKFESATEEEQRRLNGINKLVAGDSDKDAAGWSARSFASLTFAIDVDEKFKLQVTNKVPERSVATILSVDLSRPGQPTENIWHLDGRPRTVTRQEYKSVFSK